MVPTRQLLILAALPVALLAQEKRPAPQAYKVEFTLREAGNPKAAKFMMTAVTGRNASIHTTLRVPYQMKSADGKISSSFYEAGLRLQCSLRDEGEMQSLSGEVEVSGPKGAKTSAEGGMPEMQILRTNFMTRLTPGKSQLVASVQDPASGKTVEIEVLPTLIP